MSRSAAILVVAVFAVVVLRSAWVHEDAYITFRTVDNFVNGYGLRWNPAERVQTYTHPLWMFAVSAGYAVTGEVFFTVTALSIVLSAGAVALLVFGAAQSIAAGCVAAAALTFSRAFVDYSTSGLENSLTHFLYASFLTVFFRREKRLGLLALIASLAAVNRLDTLLLYLPALAVALVIAGRSRVSSAAVLAAGFVPLMAWEAFSLFYYGFPFPNTAYAKLFETGIGAGARVAQGLHYLLNSVRLDPLTLVVVGGGLAAGLLSTDRRAIAGAAGIGAYLAYVVLIGGDFVTGRFLSAPAMGAAVLLARWEPVSRAALAGAAAIVVILGLSGDRPASLMDPYGIADERPYYAPYTGFMNAIRGTSVADHPWAREGQDARTRQVPVVFRGDIGFFGFYAGPAVHVVDAWGLADPLIARIPARTDARLRIGHFTRAIPEGYRETLETGRNQIVDRRLADLYDRLALITRGPLFDGRRLREIWKINVSERGARAR
jgi:arabinofuranosyltransferase